MTPNVVSSCVSLVGGERFGIFIALALFRCRTIALETGFQNSQLCSTIIQLSFSFKELELMFAFPLIYSIFQLVVAIIFVGGKSLHGAFPPQHVWLMKFEDQLNLSFQFFGLSC